MAKFAVRTKKYVALALAALLVLSLAACGDGGETTSTTPAETTTEADETEPEETTTEAEETEPEETEPEETEPEETEPEETEDPDADADPNQLPRDQTVYFNGQQWGSINDWNPLSPNSNNTTFAHQDAAREVLFETLYMYNQLDNQLYPLLADGDYVVDGMTYTIKIKEAAHWSDGEPLTANDVVFSFEVQRDLETRDAALWDYVESVEASDDYTVVITAKEDNYNPLKILELLPKLYILPQHGYEVISERHDGDPEGIKTDVNEECIASGPYRPYFEDETKWVLIRDDNYWGQDESMWGQLPVPKYLAHNIFADNAAGNLAFQQGEVDAAQQFMPEVWKLWEDGLPVTTYLDEPPYYLPAAIPTGIFNLQRPFTGNVTIRRALAMATDYEQIGTTAMSGYTPPMNPSLMNPSDFEQGLLDYSQLEDLQWTGKQVDEANALLDDAGIVDSDGDGYRELDGEKIEFTVECPTGWSDWNAALEMVAAAGQDIGLDISTYFPEAPVWTEDLQTGNFDFIMNSYAGASIANPWTRHYQTLYSEHGDLVDAERVFWNYGRFSNERVDELIDEIPVITDEDELREMYTEINKIYLEEVPVMGLMYRPAFFHTMNETVWTGFPEADDGSNIPPTVLTDGYGVAALYNLELVDG